MYAEGGDFGYANNATEIWPYFGTLYAGDGNASGNVQNLIGVPGTLGDGLDFAYLYGQGPDAWVDEFDVTTGILIYRDQSSIGRIVAHDASSYRTILSSVIFGALQGTDRGELMARYVNYLLIGTGAAEKPGEKAAVAFAVTPNPAPHGSAVRFVIPKGQAGQLTIVGASGQIVARRAVDGQDIELKLDAPAGTYFARFTRAATSVTHPFVIMR